MYLDRKDNRIEGYFFIRGRRRIFEVLLHIIVISLVVSTYFVYLCAETVEGGGAVIILLKGVSSLKQLYTMTMDVHSRLAASL